MDPNYVYLSVNINILNQFIFCARTGRKKGGR